MGQVRHGSATTTHAVRAAMQRSQASLSQLSKELGTRRTIPNHRRGGKSLVHTDYMNDFIDTLATLGFRTFTNCGDNTDEERLRVIARNSLKA